MQLFGLIRNATVRIIMPFTKYYWIVKLSIQLIDLRVVYRHSGFFMLFVSCTHHLQQFPTEPQPHFTYPHNPLTL